MRRETIYCDTCTNPINKPLTIIAGSEFKIGEATTKNRQALDFCNKQCLCRYLDKELKP